MGLIQDAVIEAVQEQQRRDRAEAESQRKQEYDGVIKKCPSCGAELQSFTAFCPNCGHELRAGKVDDSVKEFFEKLTDYSGGYETGSDEDKRKSFMDARFILFSIAACAFMVALIFKDEGFPFLPIVIGIFFAIIGIFLQPPMTQEEKKKRAFIETFVVPNNKESILEFLMLSASQIHRNTNPFTKAGKENSFWNAIWKVKIKQTMAKARITLSNDSDALAKIQAIKQEFHIR